MKRLRTLRIRFGLWTAGLFLIILSAFGVFVYGSMARGLTATVDDALTLVAAQVIAGLDIDKGQLVLTDGFVQEPENLDLRARGFTVRILSPEGQELQAFGPHQAWLSALEHPNSTPAFTTLPNPSLRVYTLPIENDQQPLAMLQIAQSLAGVEDTLGRLRATLLVSVPLLVIVAGVSGYFLAARALAPIDQITRTARRISAEDLSARLNLPGPDDEVGRLASTFDAMLARLDDSFQHERRFIADASHELRTPLTAMQAILGHIRGKPRTVPEYELALADLAEETDRLRALTESLLRLARSDAAANAPREQIDFSTLLRDVADSARPLAEAKGLSLTTHISNDLSLMGDRDELIRLLMNLLDNAIKYTERGGLTLSASSKLNGVSVTLADTGPGIPAEHLPHIFERFYRVEQSRTLPGAGLGLAIALEIAHAHGGSIEVSSELGHGTRFTVLLPEGSRKEG